MDVSADISFFLPGYVFWDTDRGQLDLLKDKSMIVSRMFERGKLDDVLSVIVVYGKEEVARVLQDNKYLSRQGLFLAHALLGLPLQDFKSYILFKHRCNSQ